MFEVQALPDLFGKAQVTEVDGIKGPAEYSYALGCWHLVYLNNLILSSH
mgnify:CR=1 FL=1